VIRYRYHSQITPPAPFVHVALSNPTSGAQLQNVPALLDTAADRTVLPASVVQSLGQSQISTILIGGVGGTARRMPSYAVLLAIHNLQNHSLEVVSDPNEVYVLLGRDVLNSHPILFDGPQLVLEIG
jgi:hypothetical protein